MTRPGSADADRRATAQRPAALLLARAPGAPDVLAGLAPLLSAERRAAVQAILVRRATAWAAAAAPGAAFVAVTPGERVEEVAAIVPAGVRSLPSAPADPAEALSAAIAQIGHGPLLIAHANCPRLGPEHAAAALADLGAGCDVVFGSSLEGTWYLVGLREPRPELLAVTSQPGQRPGGIGPVLQRARELDAAVGMLRHERLLAAPGDAAALLADPLAPEELRAALSA